jgi:hypothetical protein
MRFKRFLAMAAAMLSFGLVAVQPAEAFGFHRETPPAGWGNTQTVKHWVYYPRYHHVYLASAKTDPYAYQYRTRGYYPYYGSHYWRPAHEVKTQRANFKLPKYYPAWGYNKSWHHAHWHAKHHGYHHRWHW